MRNDYFMEEYSSPKFLRNLKKQGWSHTSMYYSQSSMFKNNLLGNVI